VQLIGMLDSPFVRRTAITLELLGLPFEHRALSVFRDYDTFSRINPLVKAPTLICDDGVQLIESSLIIDYAESIAAPGHSLMPGDPLARRATLRLVGLALIAAEKSVQIVYEKNRPAALQSQPWLARVEQQLKATYAALEDEVGSVTTAWLGGTQPGQADVSVAVSVGFTQLVQPGLTTAASHPALAALAAKAEQLPAFQRWPIPQD
jgi:glutathione S-transferase